MSRIPQKYHTNVLFYTKYTHPTLICRGTDARTDGRMHGRMDGWTENIYSIFRDKLLLLGEHVLSFFLAKIHNRIKSDNGALNQPIVKRLPRVGCHKYNSHATGLQRSAPPWLCSFLVGRLLGFVKLVRKYGRYVSKVRKSFST